MHIPSFLTLYQSKLLLLVLIVSNSFLFNPVKAQDTVQQKLNIALRKLDSTQKVMDVSIQRMDSIVQKMNILLEKMDTTQKQQDIVKATEDSIVDDAEDSEGKVSKVLYGKASFYANKFNGRRTANGEIFSQKKFTCACNKLPLGTWVRVTNISNGKSVVVKVNDRLHPKMQRLVDLTRCAAQKLDFIDTGLTKVKVEVFRKKTTH